MRAIDRDGRSSRCALVAGALAAAPAAPRGRRARRGAVTAASPARACARTPYGDIRARTCASSRRTMSQAAIQADLNAIPPSRCRWPASSTASGTPSSSSPAPTGRPPTRWSSRSATTPRSPASARMPAGHRRSTAPIDVFNNLCTAGDQRLQLRRQLLAVAVQPDAQRGPAEPRAPGLRAAPVVDAYGAGCANSAEMWSASQAAPIRACHHQRQRRLPGLLRGPDNFASGGFIADSEISGDLDFYGNQQYMVRNSAIGGANGCVRNGGLWNMVYSGVAGAPARRVQRASASRTPCWPPAR